jgi:glycogen operon protein
MLAHGDEVGRTQQGNNNVYCQDGELAWIDWSNLDADLLAFTRSLVSLRAAHPVFRRRRFFDGHGSGPEDPLGDLVWLRPDGTVMTQEDWENGYAKSLTVFLNGEAIDEPGPRGERIVDDSFLLLFNAHHEPLPFTLPGAPFGTTWETVVDTDGATSGPFAAGAEVDLTERSMLVLRRVPDVT